MKIPKEFELFGHTITVEWRVDLIDKEGVMGMAHFRENRIDLQDLSTGAYKARPQDIAEVTFLHEVIHFALNFLRREEMEHDEALVNTLALCLHQVFKTAKY